MAGWMWNQSWGTYEDNKILKILWIKSNLEDIMKMILKECEDEDGYEGGGFVHEISRPMKNFKDRWWSLSWKASRPTYFQKIWWKYM